MFEIYKLLLLISCRGRTKHHVSIFLESIFLQDNSFSSSLPAKIGNLQSLGWIDVSNNELEAIDLWWVFRDGGWELEEE